MILGLRSAIYPTPELAAGRDWYARVLGVEPYFDQQFYVGFSVGGFELGLIPDGRPGALGAQPYWGVADIETELSRLAGLGATPNEPAKDVGGGIKVGSVLDPFGNVLCLIENPQFDAKAVR
jgi:catechol 2,3-dioxygenase-like lactoylglutathione lyase family enzyme